MNGELYKSLEPKEQAFFDMLAEMLKEQIRTNHYLDRILNFEKEDQ